MAKIIRRTLAAVCAVAALLAFLGYRNPLPSDIGVPMSWALDIDEWLINHAALPGLFILFALGASLLMVPDLWKGIFEIRRRVFDPPKPSPTLKLSFDEDLPECVARNIDLGHNRQWEVRRESSTINSPYTSSSSTLHSMTFTPITRLTYYCLKVEAYRAPLYGCYGQLDWIEKDGKRIFSDPFKLTFKRAEDKDTTSKSRSEKF